MSSYRDKVENFKKACGIEKTRIKQLLKIQENSAKHTFLICIASELAVEMLSAIHEKHHDFPHHDSPHAHRHIERTTEYYKKCWETLTALDRNIRKDDLNLLTSNCSNMIPYTKPLGDILVDSQSDQEL